MGYQHTNERVMPGGHARVAAKVRQAEADYMNALRNFGHESAEAFASKRHWHWLKGLERRPSVSGSAA